MKKILSAVICMTLATMGCMAQNNNNGQNTPEHAPKMEMQHQHKADKHMKGRHHADHVIDMKVIKEMQFSEKQMKKIADLKQRRQEEMKTLFQAPAGPRPEMKVAQMKSKKKQFDRNQMRQVNEKYRKELQKIMGKKNYICYVEKVNDRLAMHQPKPGMKNDKHFGKHRPGHQPHTGMKPAVMPRPRA